MSDIPDTITVFQVEYTLSDHAKVRMEERNVTASQISQTLEDGACREQSHGTDICEKDFWDEEKQVSREIKVVVDRDIKEIVTVIVNEPS
jgi:hypothetical protein